MKPIFLLSGVSPEKRRATALLEPICRVPGVFFPKLATSQPARRTILARHDLRDLHKSGQTRFFSFAYGVLIRVNSPPGVEGCLRTKGSLQANLRDNAALPMTRTV
jgi:hypothetical protein